MFNQQTYWPFLISFVLTSLLSSSAAALTCTQVFDTSYRDSTLQDYELSRLAALRGDFSTSIAINEGLRHKISTMPIKETYPENYGSHGAYKAKLDDGTLVLIKPHSRSFFSGLHKEVATSIFAEQIGLPLIPVAGYRIDPVSQKPASVHLIQKRSVLKEMGLFLRFLGRMNALPHMTYEPGTQSQLVGNEIAFLMRTLDYLRDEVQPRHVIQQRLRGQNIKSLIDLGATFVESYNHFNTQTARSIMLNESTMTRIETLDPQLFKEKLAPYLSESAIDALLLRTRLSVQAMRALQRANPAEIKTMDDFIEKNKVRVDAQRWQDAVNPPKMAIDFDI